MAKDTRIVRDLFAAVRSPRPSADKLYGAITDAVRRAPAERRLAATIGYGRVDQISSGEPDEISGAGALTLGTDNRIEQKSVTLGMKHVRRFRLHLTQAEPNTEEVRRAEEEASPELLEAAAGRSMAPVVIHRASMHGYDEGRSWHPKNAEVPEPGVERGIDRGMW